MFMTEGKEIYGIITLSINWIPGIVAAIHLLSMYRNRLPWHRVLLFALLAVVLYPVIPILAYINLLWKKPKNSVVTKEFQVFLDY